MNKLGSRPSFTWGVHQNFQHCHVRISGKFIISITEMKWYVWVFIVLNFPEVHASWKWVLCTSYEHVASGMTIIKLDFKLMIMMSIKLKLMHILTCWKAWNTYLSRKNFWNKVFMDLNYVDLKIGFWHGKPYFKHSLFDLFSPS